MALRALAACGGSCRATFVPCRTTAQGSSSSASGASNSGQSRWESRPSSSPTAPGWASLKLWRLRLASRTPGGFRVSRPVEDAYLDILVYAFHHTARAPGLKQHAVSQNEFTIGAPWESICWTIV